MTEHPLLEPSEADGGHLVGRDPRQVPSEILSATIGSKSAQGHSSAVSRLLLWQRLGGSQVCCN